MIEEKLAAIERLQAEIRIIEGVMTERASEKEPSRRMPIFNRPKPKP
jgi:hypothetical protein